MHWNARGGKVWALAWNKSAAAMAWFSADCVAMVNEAMAQGWAPQVQEIVVIGAQLGLPGGSAPWPSCIGKTRSAPIK